MTMEGGRRRKFEVTRVLETLKDDSKIKQKHHVLAYQMEEGNSAGMTRGRG